MLIVTGRVRSAVVCIRRNLDSSNAVERKSGSRTPDKHAVLLTSSEGRLEIVLIIEVCCENFIYRRFFFFYRRVTT